MSGGPADDTRGSRALPIVLAVGAGGLGLLVYYALSAALGFAAFSLSFQLPSGDHSPGAGFTAVLVVVVQLAGAVFASAVGVVTYRALRQPPLTSDRRVGDALFVAGMGSIGIFLGLCVALAWIMMSGYQDTIAYAVPVSSTLGALAAGAAAVRFLNVHRAARRMLRSDA